MPPQSTPTPAPNAAARLTQAQILADVDVTPNRTTKTTITEAKEFSLLEKARNIVPRLLPTGIKTREQERRSTTVLYLWDSDDGMITMPVLNDKKLKETSVAAGYFITNLPVTPSNRKRGQTFQTNPQRMARCPAYMSVKFEPNSEGKDFRISWRDEGCLTVSTEFARLKEGKTKAKAIETAIVNWDKCERARAEKYNTELIIALARMHTVRFAKEGTGHPPHIPYGLQVNQRRLKCQSISDDFEEHYTITKEIHDRLKARKIGRRHHIIS
ncbi:hypothetical protein FPHYL_6024 [Fusarium phyllophilum]|uniref:Uncharacterized protein n=1 Tax=Fusarium phyllophilum TaxID=47803 RepID=A0A8H5NCM5_9HYPO|nr:hypothetical protein FPHYL_6024 [Fusarium phyllophilum]